MDLPKRRVLMKAFITSQFSYCPLIWMYHSRTLNNGINNIHERALRLTYKDNQSSFKELLEKDHSVTVLSQALVTEIFKVKNDLAPDIMKDLLELKEPLLFMVSHELSPLLHKYRNLLHKALKNVRL